jgi:hypothetical protein
MQIHRLCFPVIVPVLFIISQNVNAQDSDASHKQCEFSEVYQPGGWKIPGLAEAVPTSQRRSLQTSPGGVVPGVFVTELKAKSISKLLVPRCEREFPGRISLLSKTVKVINMSKVDFNGKVFAYVVDYEPQFVEKNGLQGTLSFMSLVFLDVDGTGRFTVMRFNYQPKKSFLLSPDIPECDRPDLLVQKK